MKRRSKLIKIIALLIISLFLPFLGSINKNAFAEGEADACGDGVPDSVKEAAGCNGNDGEALPNAVQNIVTSIVVVLGVVAIIFVVVGAINYITSNGETAKIEKAKKTIIYALIGLAVAALSGAIVNWTISIIPK